MIVNINIRRKTKIWKMYQSICKRFWKYWFCSTKRFILMVINTYQSTRSKWNFKYMNCAEIKIMIQKVFAESQVCSLASSHFSRSLQLFLIFVFKKISTFDDVIANGFVINIYRVKSCDWIEWSISFTNLKYYDFEVIPVISSSIDST